MAKNAIQKCVSPKGMLEWVTISGEGKEDLQGNPTYVASLILDPSIPEHQAFIDANEEFWEKNKPKGFKGDPKSTGIRPHKVKKLDEDGNPIKEDDDFVYEEDGLQYVQFKTGTTYADGKPKKIQVFNSKAKPVELGDTGIGNESIGQLSGAMAIYTVEAKGKVVDAGVTYYLNSVKISKLVEFTADSGFDADDDEDGWTGEEDWTGDESQANSEAGPRL